MPCQDEGVEDRGVHLEYTVDIVLSGRRELEFVRSSFLMRSALNALMLLSAVMVRLTSFRQNGK